MTFARIKRWRRGFYDGPGFIGVRPWRRQNYQSPTLTAGLWIYALSVRHFTMTGAIVFLCCGLITTYALVTLTMPIHLLAFGLIILMVLNAAVGFVLRPRLVLERTLPERLAVGTDQPVLYSVTHCGRLPLWDLILDPVPLPQLLAFPAGRAAVEVLRPGQTVQVKTSIRALRRGHYTLPEAMAGSAFPFHLWRWTAAGSGRRTLTAYPAFTPLREVLPTTGIRYQAGGVALSSNVGSSMEFLGTREYRAGDDPRRLHWRSWARTTYPVVKEFREEYLCRTALIVDTARPKPYFWEAWMSREDRPFEATLSLAAAVADHLSRQDYIIDLFAAGPQVYRFQGGRSLGFLENILDLLACLNPHPGEPFAEFSADVIDEVARISSAVLILLTWNDLRRDLVDQLRAAGVAVKVVLVTAAETRPPGLPGEVATLQVKDILEGRCDRL
jgi:uncharacterized protein (DUF58 family)